MIMYLPEYTSLCSKSVNIKPFIHIYRKTQDEDRVLYVTVHLGGYIYIWDAIH